MGLRKANQTSFKKGQKAPNWNGFRKGNAPWNKGLKGVQVGEDAANWKGGLPECEVCHKQLSQRHPNIKLCWNCWLKSEEGLDHAISHLPKPRYGKDHWNWKGGSNVHKQSRGLAEWAKWRKEVFERDEYTCQLCFARKKFLHPHHFMGVTYYKEKRFDKDNGITLCRDCHYLLHADIQLQEAGWYMKGGD